MSQPQGTTTDYGSRRPLWCVMLILAVFSTLSVASLRSSPPKPDEAILANPGYNLAFNGNVGTTIGETRGSYLPESAKRQTYYHLPAYFFVTAAWYKLLGFGLTQVRLVSMLFGLLGLVSWYWIVRSFSGPSTGLVSMGLVGADFFYELSASTGRMDMMCCGLGAAALASYLFLRDRSYSWAMFASHAFATLCIVTHPAGVLYYLCLITLILALDRRQLSIRVVAVAAVPVLIGVALLGAFVLHDYTAFLEQMRGNLEVSGGSFHDPGLSSIPVIRSLQLELQHRYIEPFGLSAGAGSVQRLKAIVLAAYVTGLFGNLFFSGFRRQPGRTLVASMGVIAVLYLALVSPSKFPYYLAHVTAFMAAGFGMFLCSLGSPRVKWRIVSGGVLVLAGLQIGGTIYQIRQDPYHKTYLPVIEAIRKNTTPKSIIMGSCELWFGLEHDRYFIADFNLGALSGAVPDLFVMDPLYRELHELSRTQDPRLFAYVEGLLKTSRAIYQRGDYLVYVTK